MKKLVLLTAVLLLTSCSTGGLSKQNESSFVSGSGSAVFIAMPDRKPAPKISGLTLTGKEFTNSHSVATVVNVWASWCAPCRAEAPTLESFALKNQNIQFVGILTRDNLTSAQGFVKRFNITYPTLVDDSIIASFRGSLPANAIPTTIIIDSAGRVAARISGEITVAMLKDLLTRITGGAINA
jgi:thiol-disulfide isomerase/thioredoxin